MAEDMVQQTVVRALSRHDQFQRGTSMRAWLFVVLRNEFYGLYRKRIREVEDVDGVIAASIPVDEGQTSAVDLKVIRRRMRLLNAEQRRVIELAAILGHDYEDVADMLGIPVGTVKSQVHRARAILETGIAAPTEPEPAIEPVSKSSGKSIERLYRDGRSVSEIAAALGVKRSDVMRAIVELNLPARKP